MNIKAMELIMIPLFILIVGGVLYNNFSSAATMSTVLHEDPVTGTWSYYNQTSGTGNYNGCTPSICSLASPSFLNPNSPFTYLFQGDIMGFGSHLFSQPSTAQYQSQPFAFWGKTAVHIRCSNTNFYWTQIFNGSFPLSAIHDKTMVCEQDYFNGTFVGWDDVNVNIMNACGAGGCSTPFNMSWVGATASPQFFDYLVINNTGLMHTNKNLTTNEFLVVFNWNQAGQQANSFGISLNGTAIASDVAGYSCSSTGGKNASALQATGASSAECTQNLALITETGQQISATNATSMAGLTIALGMIAGIILLLIGLGLGIGGGALTFNFSLSPNDQGTRLAQVIGIGLLLWIPLFSEFGTWLNTLTLGLSTILTTILTLMFFLGIWWQTQSFL